MKSINFNEEIKSLKHLDIKEEPMNLREDISYRLGSLYAFSHIKHLHGFPIGFVNIFKKWRDLSIQEKEDKVKCWCDWVIREEQSRKVISESATLNFIKDIFKEAFNNDILVMNKDDEDNFYR